MNSFMKIIALFASLFVSIFVFAQENISPSEAEKLLQDTTIQLLDVRTPGEFQSGYIPHALHADWLDKQEFKRRTESLDKNKPLLVYCASGGRSSQAAKWFEENGFKNVYNLDGGITAWKQENRAIKDAANVEQMDMKTYQSLIADAKSEMVLVDFGAECCPPCRKMEPVLQQLQKDIPNEFTLIKIDGGVNTSLMKQVNAQNLPSFILYKNGKEVWRKEGVVAQDELKEQLSK